MSAEVVNLAGRRVERTLRELREKLERLQEVRDGFVVQRERPETAAKVLFAQVVEIRTAHSGVLERARGPLLRVLALLLAEQELRGEPRDVERALALALGDTSLAEALEQQAGERLGALAVELERLSRVYGRATFEDPPPEPGAA